MRLRVIFLAAILMTVAAPALAQTGPQGSESNGAHSEGSSVSGGTSESSASITTSGPASVGASQGNNASGSTSFGGSGNGAAPAPAVADATAAKPSAVDGGVVSAEPDVPTGTVDDTQTASSRGSDFLTWAIVALIVVGFVLLYRRLPKGRVA